MEWRRDMEVNDGDRAWAKAMPYYIQNEDEKLPPVGRFNFGQKLFFWGIFLSVILLLLTGVAYCGTRKRCRGVGGTCAMWRY